MKRSLSMEHKTEECHSRKLRKVTAVINKIPPQLPDLVIDKALGLLPTKDSLRMSFLSKQWESVWSSFNPTIDFDEGGENDYNSTDQHKKFINILRRYLELYEKEEQKGTLDKLRLCMTRYLPEDAGMVNELLRVSIQRGVRELEISLSGGSPTEKYHYSLSPMSFVHAKSLTVLKLNCVRITEMNDTAGGVIGEPPRSMRFLPSLKTMCLKNVDFDSSVLSVLIKECPSIEHLSLISCACSSDYVMKVRSSSLKSLEVKQCKASVIHIINAVNLESLTILSSNSDQLRTVRLNKCFKLKYMNICAQYMKMLDLYGCNAVVEGTIDAPGLRCINFEGDLKSKFSLKAPKLKWASIRLADNQGGTEHFLRFKEFLEGFGRTEMMALVVRDYKDLVFPKNFRKGFPSILPKLEDLDLQFLHNRPTNMREMEDLHDSLRWMSPSVNEISIK